MISKRSYALAAACAALFSVIAAHGLQEPGFHHEEVFQAVDGMLFAFPALRDHVHWAHPLWFWGRLPWMSLPYIGSPKVYLYAAAFRLFGAKWQLVRALNVLLGAAAVFWSVLLGCGLFGLLPGAALGLWMAADPALILFSRYDEGPVMFTMAAKMAGLYFLWRGAAGNRRGPMFLGGLLCGLCLWDKAHFLWWLAALAASCAVCYPSALKRQRELAMPMAGGFLLGAFPFFLYNLEYPLDTFLTFVSLRQARPAAWLQILGDPLASRRAEFLGMLSGASRYAFVSGEQPPAAPVRAAAAWAAVALCAGAAAWLAAHGGRKTLTPFLFWTTMSAALTALAFATPLKVVSHHFFLLYPLPLLAAAALAGALLAEPGILRGLVCAALALLLGAWLVGNARMLRDFEAALARTGGSPPWYRGFRTLEKLCEDQGGTVELTACKDVDPLIAYSEGRLRVEEDLRTQCGGPQGCEHRGPKAPAALSLPGTLLVTDMGTHSDCEPQDTEAERFVQQEAERPDSRLALVARIPYSDGTPWAQVYRVK